MKENSPFTQPVDSNQEIYMERRRGFKQLAERGRKKLSPLISRGRGAYERSYNGLLKKPATALLVRIFQEFGKDQGSNLAAVIAYNAVLSLFPLFLGLTAVLSLFLSSQTIQQQILSFAQQNFPTSVDLVRTNINQVITHRGILAVVSVIGLFWTGANIFTALGQAINRAWDITSRGSFIKTKLRDLAMAFGTGLLLVISFGITVGASYVHQLNLPFPNLVDYGARFLSFLLIFGIFLVVYKYVPRTRTQWEDVWPGALLGAVLFEVARTAFAIYLVRNARYDVIYGPMSSAIILLVWIYYSSVIVIFGAEFSSELNHYRRAVKLGATPWEYARSQHEPALSYKKEGRVNQEGEEYIIEAKKVLKTERGGSLFPAFISGTLIGVFIGLLLAPQSGPGTRKLLKQRSGSVNES